MHNQAKLKWDQVNTILLKMKLGLAFCAVFY